jgi:hypothetical protein
LPPGNPDHLDLPRRGQHDHRPPSLDATLSIALHASQMSSGGWLSFATAFPASLTIVMVTG